MANQKNKWNIHGNWVKRGHVIKAVASDELTGEFICAACNHYARFLGEVEGHEEAGDPITEQMEMFK